MRLQGKVVLVTGAASGIGHAVAELFAKEGATVFAGDISSPKAAYSEGIEAMKLDVTSEERLGRRCRQDRRQAAGRLDVLINNAGIIAYEPLDELDIEKWMKMIAVDQTGVFLGMREAVRVMRKQKAGAIVNISSIWGSAAVAGAHSYHAVKGAVRNMSKNAAITYVGDGIRVNSVHPGFIDTPLTQAQDADLNEAVIAATPMRRAGKPEEVAYGCLFLASDEASYVTGIELADRRWLSGAIAASKKRRRTRLETPLMDRDERVSVPLELNRRDVVRAAGATMVAGAGAIVSGTTSASAQTAGRGNDAPLGLRLQGVQHFGLTVQNMDRAFEFYTEVLGGTEIMRDGDFQGERIHNTLLTDQEIEAREREVNPRTMGVPDLRGGAQRLDVRFIQFDNVVIELLQYRDAEQPAGSGAAFAEPLDHMSPAFPRMMHICFHIRDDVDFNKFIADLEAESAKRGMPQVRANRVVTVTTEKDRLAAPLEANSNGITEGKSNGWRLIYCKGSEGEQLEFVQALGPVKEVFAKGLEAHNQSRL